MLAAAALHASWFLTGMSATEQEHVRAMWAQKRQLEALARMKVLEKDLDHLARAGTILIGFQLKCADQPVVASAQRNQAAAKAAFETAISA